MAIDRDHLLGSFAVQLGFLTREALVRALDQFPLDDERPLGEYLVAIGLLAPRDRELLEDLLDLVSARGPDSPPSTPPASTRPSGPPGAPGSASAGS